MLVELGLGPWPRPSRAAAIALTIAAALLLLAIRASGGYVPVLDDANLVFHEAGHVIYGIFGQTPGLYGGTLGQLTMPAVVWGTFWARRKPVSVAVAALWFFQNFFNIGRYAADARAQELPLVGGGEHDWTEILGRWHLLHADLRVGRVMSLVAVLGFVGVIAWTFMRTRRGEEPS